MLSVRLPQPLKSQLTAFCKTQHLTKSAVVQLALEKHLSLASKLLCKTATANPFASLRGTGNRKLSTEQIMRMTRGDDWNRP
jgi:predicted DNA-binding protein